MADALLVLPAIVCGVAIGAYEAILIHRDVSVPTHRFGHSVHAVVIAVIACFVTMNTAFVVANVPQLQNLGFFSQVIVLQAITGLIMAVKIHATSRAIQGSVGGSSVGLGETWAHSIIVGGLTIAAPYLWPLLAPMMPVWLGGTTAK